MACSQTFFLRRFSLAYIVWPNTLAALEIRSRVKMWNGYDGSRRASARGKKTCGGEKTTGETNESKPGNVRLLFQFCSKPLLLILKRTQTQYETEQETNNDMAFVSQFSLLAAADERPVTKQLAAYTMHVIGCFWVLYNKCGLTFCLIYRSKITHRTGCSHRRFVRGISCRLFM